MQKPALLSPCCFQVMKISALALCPRCNVLACYSVAKAFKDRILKLQQKSLQPLGQAATDVQHLTGVKILASRKISRLRGMRSLKKRRKAPFLLNNSLAMNRSEMPAGPWTARRLQVGADSEKFRHKARPEGWSHVCIAL